MNGQEIVGGLESGYATFSMKQLKAHQADMSNGLPIDARIVESFPAYISYGGNITMFMDSHFYRLVIGHTSTGGRIYYSDYSGSYSLDQLLSMTYFGGQVGFKASKTGSPIQAYLGLQVLYYFNSLKFVSKQTIYDESSMDVIKFTSLNIAPGPFLELQKPVSRFLFKIQASYEIHIPGKLNYSDGDSFLVDSRNEPVKVNADGLRLGAGIGYSFNN